MTEPFPQVTQSLSTFSSACQGALRLRSLSFEQAEQLALQTADALAALLRYRNSLLPVSKLPPELLSHIFEFAAAPVDSDSRRPESTHCLPGDFAVNVARVSSSWREIALASSHLWCYITDSDIKWPSRPRMFLHRSRNAFIHVYAALPDSLGNLDNSVRPAIVHHHSNRVRELHVLVDKVYPIQDFLQSISVALPSLDYLTITAPGHTFFLPLEHFLQPPIILGGETRNLRAMTLGPDAPFLPGNSFPSLINLELRGMGRGVQVTTSILLDLLSNCPRLETFEVHFPLSNLVYAEEQPNDSDNRPPLPLRHLKALWMSHVTAAAAFALLAQLELPTVTTVRLMSLSANGFSIPRTHTLPLAHMHLAQLDILEGGRQSGPETPFELHFLAHGPGPEPRMGLWIHLFFWRGRDQPLAEQYAHEEAAFWDVLRALPARVVTALRMSTLRTAHLVRAALIVGGHRGPAMPLESVVLRSVKAGSATEQRETVDYVARALLPYDGRGRGQRDVPVPAPHLRELTIEINRAWKVGMGDLLVCALRGRKARGYPLWSVACSALSVRDPELEWQIRQQVVGNVQVTERKLWEMRRVPEVWMVKNDYWRLYPESRARTVNGWGLPENT